MKRISFDSKCRFILIIAAMLAVMVVSTVSCANPSSQNIKVTATMDDFNSLIFHIRGSIKTAGEITVQYWSEGTGPFVTAPVPAQNNTFSVEVMRLRPSTQYEFQVFLSRSSDVPVLQYQGTFDTGPLPPALQNARIQLT
jgi:hypothetical protein